MADDIDASYRVLGLKAGATPEQVKRAYRDLVKAWHPDRFPHDALLRAQAHTRTATLNAAYARVQEHLRNPPPSPKPVHPGPTAVNPKPANPEPTGPKPVHPTPPPSRRASKPRASSPGPRPGSARPRPDPTRPPVRQPSGSYWNVAVYEDAALAAMLLGIAGSGACALSVVLALATGFTGQTGGSGQALAMGVSIAVLVVGSAAILAAGIALPRLPKSKVARRGLILGLANTALAGVLLMLFR